MANRAKYPSQSYGIGREYMEIQIKTGGTGNPTIIEGAEVLSSVTHGSGTNQITITLKDSFPKLVAHAVDFRDDSNGGNYWTLGSVTGENSATVPTAPLAFKIGYFTAGGSPSNDPSNLIVVVVLAIRNSNVTAGN